MKAWLSDQDELGPVTLTVTGISLVAQSHDMRSITWRHPQEAIERLHRFISRSRLAA